MKQSFPPRPEICPLLIKAIRLPAGNLTGFYDDNTPSFTNTTNLLMRWTSCRIKIPPLLHQNCKCSPKCLELFFFSVLSAG